MYDEEVMGRRREHADARCGSSGGGEVWLGLGLTGEVWCAAHLRRTTSGSSSGIIAGSSWYSRLAPPSPHTCTLAVDQGRALGFWAGWMVGQGQGQGLGCVNG
jgi:hypothetical protein